MNSLNTQPLVSVVIPVYNSQQTLDDCIKSVINQSYKVIEIVIVNDCSTDSSKTVIDRYVSSDKRIVFVNKEKNEGLVYARKTGVEMATGKYIQYLDSDDILCDDIIERLVEKAEDAQADIVVAPFFFDVDGRLEKSLFFDFDEMSGLDYLKVILMWKAHWCVWSKFHLRSLYQQPIDRPHISLGEDVILSTQLFFYSKKVVCINEEVVKYNLTLSSMSHPANFNDAKYKDFTGYVNWVFGFVNEKGLVGELKKEMAFFHLKTTLMRLDWQKIEDVHVDMKKVLVDIKLYPEFLDRLKRRERKIVAVYRFSRWLGYLNLKHYMRQGKI